MPVRWFLQHQHACWELLMSLAVIEKCYSPGCHFAAHNPTYTFETGSSCYPERVNVQLCGANCGSSTSPAAGVIEVTEEMEEDGEEEEEEEEEEEKEEEGPDTALRRFSNTLRFCWVLLSALLDSLTAWLGGLCQEHVDISTVLRIERRMLTQQAKQGNVPTREAIHVYYQEQMMKASRESGLNYSTHEAEGQASAERGREEEEEAVSPDTDEEEAEEKPESKLGGHYPDKPEPGPVSGEDPLEPRPEQVSGADGPGEPEAEPVSGGGGPGEPEAEPVSGGGGPGEPEAEPVSGGGGPTEPEAEPVSGGGGPTEPEAEPVSGGGGPGEPEAEPVSGGGGPGEPEAEPVSGGGGPGEPEAEPVSGGGGPGEPEAEPVSGGGGPGEPEAEPVSGGGGPGEPEAEPVSGGGGPGEPEAEPVPGGGGPTEPEAEPVPGGHGPGEPEAEPVSGGGGPGEPEAEPVPGGGGPTEPEAEPVPGGGGPTEPEAEPVPGGGGPTEPEAEPVPGGGGPGEPVSAEAPSSGVEPETVTAEGDPAVEVKGEDYPECLVTKTSQRWRPKLSRMERVRSSSSSSSSEEEGGTRSTEESKPTHAGAASSPTSPCSLLLPPSYSLALGLDLQEEEVGEGFRRRLLVQTPGERSDFLFNSASTSCPPASHAQELTASELLRSRTFYDEELEASDRFYGNQHQLLQLCYALYNILAARSETVCYLVIVLNHMVSASCLTLVLPVLVFLWAMLSVPRPSKTFWMTAIIYTEVTIVIKYFFQFGFFPFNQKLEVDRSKPFHPPNILGVEKKEGYVLYDLLQLLALFYHRAILKCHGLWDQTVTTESDSLRHHDNQADSVHSATSVDPTELSSTLRRRGRRRTRSSSTQLRSPAGSLSSRAQQPGRLDLLLEKLRELSIRARKYSVSRCLSLYRPVLQFFRALVQPEYSAVTDVYVLMFLADTVDFIIIVFGFWAFGKHSAAADITSSLSEDQVPEAFLVMVLIQFGTMVIDRALYLRKTVLGKLVFQVILVFGIHFWMFFILPTVTERRFNQNLVAQLWYFVKCVYFSLSAYQIRSGYPTRVLGNFLTKSYNYLNLFLFQGFRLVPFLTELRAVMDWVWTDTTLSLSSWICVEDVYAHCFVLKCWRESEKRYPQPRGQKKKRVVKYGMGGLIVLLLICIVWFPLLFMSLIKSVAGVINRPLDVSLTITLGGFQPIFTMSAQQNQLRDLTEEDFSSFTSNYSYTPSALQFLEAYGHEDVTVAELQGSSNSLWTISPPSRQYLSQVLNLDHFPLTVSWTIQRNLSLGAKVELASGKHVTYLDDQTRLELIQLLNGTRSLPVVIQEVFPCFIRAPSDSNAKPIEQLYADDRYKDILLALERSTNQSPEIQDWWIVDQPTDSLVPVGASLLSNKSDRREAGLQMFVFSDKVSPPSLGFLAGYGIMGLYASVVLVIGKFVREFFSGISHSIMFEELPCVDRILKLCTDIFLVRETGELELEEELYAKLIFLYRSPETLIKWTRR
ncbi:piezo-type mechanosensitive ion channel component 2-like isoform X2 [Sebastes fasciatus]|uniref:piezo-type mechanosensitive ion channel component 2-like isoform X2 n=1 Tax=Sebastes fasciatus TaxID=394691 RepID=UPI003D9E9D7B